MAPIVPAIIGAGKVIGALGSVGSALGGLFGGRRKPKLKSTREYMQMGQGAVNDSVAAAMSNAMPQFQEQLQGLREQAINRGVQYGDIGTRNEGSLASAFQRNLANVAGSQAMKLYETALDQRAGRQDQLTMRANNRNAEQGAMFDLLGRGLATPMGAKATGAIGGKLAGLFGGRNRTLRAMPNIPRQSADTMYGMRPLPRYNPRSAYRRMVGGVQGMP